MSSVDHCGAAAWSGPRRLWRCCRRWSSTVRAGHGRSSDGRCTYGAGCLDAGTGPAGRPGWRLAPAGGIGDAAQTIPAWMYTRTAAVISRAPRPLQIPMGSHPLISRCRSSRRSCLAAGITVGTEVPSEFQPGSGRRCPAGTGPASWPGREFPAVSGGTGTVRLNHADLAARLRPGPWALTWLDGRYVVGCARPGRAASLSAGRDSGGRECPGARDSCPVPGGNYRYYASGRRLRSLPGPVPL
jgi:hypothetical protein